MEKYCRLQPKHVSFFFLLIELSHIPLPDFLADNLERWVEVGRSLQLCNTKNKHNLDKA